MTAKRSADGFHHSRSGTLLTAEAAALPLETVDTPAFINEPTGLADERWQLLPFFCAPSLLEATQKLGLV